MSYELLMLQTVNMVMGNPSTCTQSIKLMFFLNEFLKATHPTTHQRLRQSTLAVLLIEEGIKPKEEEEDGRLAQMW